MIKLFPRLPRAIAVALANERASLSIEAARDIADTSHIAATFATTGGPRIQTSELRDLAASIRDLARECGYPEPRSSTAKDQIDGRLGRLLHESSQLTSHEACRDEVWNFLGCVLLPDVVRWRFSGAKTDPKNFLGNDRGIYNALGRCWWAAELLHDDNASEDPYSLLLQLGVDETVGFSRRPQAVVNRRVAQTLAQTVVNLHEYGFVSARLDLMRDAMKRFLRLAPLVSFESLNDDELRMVMWDIANTSAHHVARAKGHPYEPPPRPQPAPRPTLPRELPAGDTPAVSESNDDFASLETELSSLLGTVNVDSRSPNRFDVLKTWLGERLQLPPDQVSIKRLADAKNYRNRIGESLRHHPTMSLLLHTGDSEGVLTAVESRLQLSGASTVVLCGGTPSEQWAVHSILATRWQPTLSKLAATFPDANVVVSSPNDESAAEHLDPVLLGRLIEAIAPLPLGLEQAVQHAQSIATRILASSGCTIRVKRIVDSKNIGNRVSEGLGANASMLILGVESPFFQSAEQSVIAQAEGMSDPPLVVVLATDPTGYLTHIPTIIGEIGESEDDEGVDDDEVESDEDDESKGKESKDNDSIEAEDEEPTDDLDEPLFLGFLDLDTLEDQAVCVTEHLMFHGSLTKSDAIRLAAEKMRDAGQLHYQRLRTNGRIHRAILAAIEAGVRAGYLDRPRRGWVRATLTSADDFTKEDWVQAVVQALPESEEFSRDEVVRMTAVWARDNLGLEFKRLRKSGKIDTGVRNALRTLIRRDRMERASSGRVVLLED